MNDVMKSMLKFKEMVDKAEKEAAAEGKTLKTYFVTGDGNVARLDEDEENETDSS